jgi:uncharacterized membrane protein
MILFSDAVFAIAITLLIIEIKVPALHGPGVDDSALLRELRTLVPKFLGFAVSFVIIGMYWTRHHFIFGYVADYTPKLLWLNLGLLFSIVLMPFSTGIFGEYSTPSAIHLKTPLVVYVLNIALVGLMNFLLWSYVGNPANAVSDGRLDQQTVRAAKYRAAAISLVFLLTVPVAFLNAYAARYVPILIPLALKIVRRRMAVGGERRRAEVAR